MKKHTYSLAGVSVEVTHTHDGITRTSADYETAASPEIRLSITEADIARERAQDDTVSFPAAYWESLAFLRQVSDALANFDVFLFHGVAVEVDGYAYIFTAPSGTGKSTHAAIWGDLLGARMTVINGDKPFIRQANGAYCAYGSPWNGKERSGENISAPIRGICFLHRSEQNEIRKISAEEAFPLAYRQTYQPTDVEAARRVLLNMTEMLGSCALYDLGCNISPDAGKLSFETMTGGTL